MFGVYAVAVRVSLINDVSSGLMGLSRQFGVVNGNAKQLEQTLKRIKLTAMGGMGLAAIGGAGLWAVSKTIAPAREYAHQLAQMNIAGMKHADIQASIRAGWEATYALPSTTISKNLGDIRELRTVFGTTGEAINALPTVARLQAVLSNVKGVTDARGTAFEVAKAIDLRNKTGNAADFKAEADAMTKALVASGGTLNASDFFGTFKMGKSVTAGWSQEFAYQILPTLMQELKGGSSGGGGSAGVGLMTTAQAIVGGRILQRNLPQWQALGLLDPAKVVYTKSGSAKGTLPGAITGADIFGSNPFEWTQKVLRPALERMPGMAGDSAAAMNARQAYIQRLVGDRNAQFMISQMVNAPKKFQRDQQTIQSAEGLAAYERLRKTDPYLAQQMLAASWENIMTRLGTEVLPSVILMTHGLVDGFVALSKWMGENRGLVRGLVIGFTLLSGVLFIAGAILTVGAAVGAFGLLFGAGGGAGVVATGLGLMGTAIAAIGWPVTLTVLAIAALGVAIYEVVKHWDAGKGVFENIKIILGGFFSWLADKAMSLLGLRAPGGPHVGAGAAWGGAIGGGLGMVGGALLGLPAGPVGVIGGGVTGFAAGRSLGTAAGRMGDKARPKGPLVPKGGGLQKMSFSGDVHLDGQRVGNVVWQRQNKELERAGRASAGGYDPGMALQPASLGYRT